MQSLTIATGFYINLPIGGVVIIVLIVFLDFNAPVRAKELTYRQQFNEFDPLGTLCFLPATFCLLLALKWGGTELPWSDGRVIACLVLSGVLYVGFIVVQHFKGETATIPPRIITQRSIASALYYSTCNGGSLLVMVFYLPIWFQSVKAVSAVKSGIDVIPMVLSLSVGAPLGGAFTFKTGYYTPCLIVSTIIASVGAGMITTFKVGTESAKWIGYQFLFGIGLGIGMQQPNLAAQTVLVKKDVPIGTSLVFFGQSLGGSIFVSIAQSIFTNKLKDHLSGVGGLNVGAILNAGATNLKKIVPPDALPAVLVAYNDALVNAYYISMALSTAGIVGALAMEWKSVKKGEGQGEKKQTLPKNAETVAEAEKV
jgi:hypothetical protein